MSELRLPWLELCIVVPLVGTAWVARLRDSDLARRTCLFFAGLTFLSAVGAWWDFDGLHAAQAVNGRYLVHRLFGCELLTIDQLSAPLLPLSALLHLLTIVVTSRTKIRRFSFAGALFSDALVLATFSCREPWGIVGLLAGGTLLPFFELLARGKPTRSYLAHSGVFIGLMVGGGFIVERETNAGGNSNWGMLLVLGALCVRCGIFPFHGWIAGLFEHATFGLAILFFTPMIGIYGVVRLIVPLAPDWMMWELGLMALMTAIYASGMSLVQNDVRRFYCYLFLAHSSLILVGIGTLTSIGTTGALCIWPSVSLAMTGLGLTLRALEARRGRLFMRDYQGLYEHTPNLAMCFGLTGLAAVGFPGTFGFVGMEILMDGVVAANPLMGVAVVIIGALNGIAIVRAFFQLFTGTQYASSVSLLIRPRERYGVLTLAALILIGGINPQGRVASRHEAAVQLLRDHTDRGNVSKKDLERVAIGLGNPQP